MAIKDYKWLSDTLAQLPERLPGALLLYGQRGVGKQLLAESLSQGLLCTNSGEVGHPCGRCPGCHLFEVGNHPDFRRLQPEKDVEEGTKIPSTKGGSAPRLSSLIKVDAVRELADLVANASHRGGARVILVTSAESLHPSAGNALLKMLEEPGRDTHFILVSNDISRILPTIKSRCFQLSVNLPASSVSTEWLNAQQTRHAEAALCLSSYAPLAARALSEDEDFWSARGDLIAALATPSVDPFNLTGIAEKLDPLVLARLLGMWVFDLLALQHGAEARYHRDMNVELSGTARRVAGKDLCRWNNKVRDFARAAEHPLNRRLALESLFISWPGAS